MRQIQPRKIDARGLRQAITTLAVAAGLAGWAVLARPESAPSAATPAAAPAAQAAVAQVTASAPTLRAVTAAPAPVTTTRSSR